jgi:hypothetical protein
MPTEHMKTVLFWTTMLAIPIAVVGIGLAIFGPLLQEQLEGQLVAYVAATLSAEERESIYREIGESYGGLWDVVSEADVARIARRNATGVENQVEVRTNNAGMRSSHPYRIKPKGVYRIACLGDSMVLGSGGLEEDRFCDQLEEFYREKGITVDGAALETVALGLSSWTLVQEATYLASRLSAYDPDLILLLSVQNDITDSYGVTGTGSTTRAFSPEHRSWGSAFFHNKIGYEFGNPKCCSALQYDLSPESRARWDKAIGRLSRLVELQHRRGKHTLLSVLDKPRRDGRYSWFTELFRFHIERAQIDEPLVVVKWPLREPGMSLPHDPSHPTRIGHTVLRDQYIHVLDRLGWIPVPKDDLPLLSGTAPTDLRGTSDTASLQRYRQSYVKQFIPQELDFENFDPKWTHAILGGLFPDRTDRPLESPPWGSVRAGLVLRRPTGTDPQRVEIEIMAPPSPELFPLAIDVSIQGEFAGRFVFPEPHDSGHYHLDVPVQAVADDALVIEVLLETSSYFVHFNNGRMRSYQLVSARLH